MLGRQQAELAENLALQEVDAERRHAVAAAHDEEHLLGDVALGEQDVAPPVATAAHEGLQPAHGVPARGLRDAAGELDHLPQPIAIDRQQQNLQQAARIERVHVEIPGEGEVGGDRQGTQRDHRLHEVGGDDQDHADISQPLDHAHAWPSPDVPRRGRPARSGAAAPTARHANRKSLMRQSHTHILYAIQTSYVIMEVRVRAKMARTIAAASSHHQEKTRECKTSDHRTGLGGDPVPAGDGPDPSRMRQDRSSRDGTPADGSSRTARSAAHRRRPSSAERPRWPKPRPESRRWRRPSSAGPSDGPGRGGKAADGASRAARGASDGPSRGGKAADGAGRAARGASAGRRHRGSVQITLRGAA